MINAGYLAILAGLVFGLVFIWQGVGAAFIVLAFSLLGWLIWGAITLVRRAVTGEIDMEAVKQLLSMIFSGTRRRN